MSDEKPAAVLTNAQRDYLNGESVSDSYERKLRKGIRDRIEASMGDFATLFSKLEQEEVRETFGTATGKRSETDRRERHNAHRQANDVDEIEQEDVEQDVDPRTTGPNASAALAFFLRGLNYGDERIHKGLDEIGEQQPAFRHLTEAIEQAVSLYLREETPYMADVNVSIELENVEHQEEFLDSLKDE